MTERIRVYESMRSLRQITDAIAAADEAAATWEATAASRAISLEDDAELSAEEAERYRYVADALRWVVCAAPVHLGTADLLSECCGESSSDPLPDRRDDHN